MQLLVILAAAAVAIVAFFLAARRETASRPKTWRAGDAEFAEELVPRAETGAGPESRLPPEIEYVVPSRYGDNNVTLMVRDPQWLYAYWEVEPGETRRTAEREGVDLDGSSPVLRLYEIADGRAIPYRDVMLTEHADRWYVSGVTPARAYYAEVGRLTRSGRFLPLARSNRVTTPPAGVSPVISPEWPPLEWPQGGPGAGVSSPEFLK